MKKINRKGIIIFCLASILILLYMIYDSTLKAKNVNKNIEINTYCILTDANNCSVSLKEFKGKLIFFFSQYNCMPCVSQQLQSIKDAEPHLNSNDLIIVSDFGTGKDLQILKNAKKFKFRVFRTTDRLFKNEEIKFTVPLFLTFNEKFCTEDLFLCHDISGGQTEYFLERFYSTSSFEE